MGWWSERVVDAGLQVERLEQSYLTGPVISKPWGCCSLVTASKP